MTDIIDRLENADYSNAPSRCIEAAREIKRLREAMANISPLDPLADLVVGFSKALLEKLRAAEVKYGYKNAWMRSDWEMECQQHLSEHLAKGDPRDVAAYAAFCWYHGWPTVPRS